jgi:hypothetical protein
MSSPYGAADTSVPGQAVNALSIVAVIVILMFTADTVYRTVYDAAGRLKTLVDYTANAEDMPLTIRQDKNKYPKAIPIGLSSNERTGTEFAYSFYLYVNNNTFKGTDTYHHVFHKGYQNPWPLMGPGVFVHDTNNTMRVVMNTFNKPFSYVDVQNIPVDKWFHVVLNCYKNGLDVFVNGYLATRMNFERSLPYQNFGDIHIFSPSAYQIRPTNFGAAPTGGFLIDGTIRGYISKLIYARYALSTSEVKSLMNEGPSGNRKERILQEPPYMSDDWWVSQGLPAAPPVASGTGGPVV